MAEKKNPLKHVRVEVRSTSPVLKIVVIVLILFSITALVALRWVHAGILEETEVLASEAAKIEHENQVLEEKIEELDSVQGVQDIAREELDLHDPDMVIIDPQS